MIGKRESDIGNRNNPYPSLGASALTVWAAQTARDFPPLSLYDERKTDTW